METTVTEIAPDIYRLSTYVPDADFMFNQFLVDADEPLLFQTGPRSFFPLVSAAVQRLVPVDRLHWITFGHVESDECGSMNNWLAASPSAQVAHGALGCQVSVADLADRAPRPPPTTSDCGRKAPGCTGRAPPSARRLAVHVRNGSVAPTYRVRGTAPVPAERSRP